MLKKIICSFSIFILLPLHAEIETLKINELSNQNQEVCVNGIVSHVTSIGVYLSSPNSENDNDITTSEGIFAYTKGHPKAEQLIVNRKAKVCGYYSLREQRRQIEYLKYDVKILQSNQVDLDYAKLRTFRNLKVDTIDIEDEIHQIDEVFLEEEKSNIEWLENYENMVVNINESVVVKGQKTGLDKKKYFFIKDSKLSTPVQVSKEILLETGTTLEPFKALVKEGLFGLVLVPLEELKIKEPHQETKLPVFDSNASLRIVTFNVKNLTSIDKEAIFNKCMSSNVLKVTASGKFKSILEKNFPDQDEREKELKDTYCEIVKGQTPKADKMPNLAKQIINQMGMPDIVALQEIQDDDGVLASDEKSATKTLSSLIGAISSPGGKKYVADIQGVDQNIFNPKNIHKHGGQQGANIRNAFLFKNEFIKKAENLKFITNIIDSTNQVMSDGSCGISSSEEIFQKSRYPVAVEFEFENKKYLVINLHLSSNFRGRTREKIKSRFWQLKVVTTYVEDYLAENADTNIILMGDFNDYPKSDSFKGLGKFKSYVTANPIPTHNYQGIGHQLDYIFTRGNIENKSKVFVVPYNARYVNTYTDHNPVIIEINE